MAQTSVSGRIFENDLKRLVNSLVWHNRYLGDKHDKEDKYVDAEEIDIYLTGARHLLMNYSQVYLETIENKTEAEYMRQRPLFNKAVTDSSSIESWEYNQLMYWDMFYYGVRFSEASYDTDEYGRFIANNNLVAGLKKYEEKNTYYRELYGLPEYNGRICHCNRCQYENYNMKKCTKCGSTDVDTNVSAPSIYSHIMEFPLYHDRYLHDEWDPEKYPPPGVSEYTEEEAINYFLNNVYNPKVYLYNLPLSDRLYAEQTVTFVADKKELVANDSHYKYLDHMTYAKIHPFVARLSDRFELLYLKSSDIVFLSMDFRKVYEECRKFMNYRYYTEAFRNQYSQYEGFIGMAILFMTLQRMQSKYLEADITRDFYDLESIEVVYNAYSVPFYNEIPVTYHNKIIKAINKLISIKGTNKCFREIFNIFGYATLNMYQYYILKTQKRDANGNPIFMFNEDGSENMFNEKSRLETMYDVRIVKADIGENPYTYLIDSLNYMDYYGVTEPDTYWLNDEDLLHKLYTSDYNFIETKYIGVEMVFHLTRFTIETEYIMRMLLDNRNNGTNSLSVYHNGLGTDIDLYTLVVYIMYIIGLQFGLENGGSLEPLTDPAKLSAIYGFNFIEDFTSVFGYLSRKFIYNYKCGYISDANFYIDTDYSWLNTRPDITSLPEDVKTSMSKEMILNNISTDNIYDDYISSGYINQSIYNGGTGISCELKYKLVYAFNTIRRILTTYTPNESRVRNLLNSKFVNVYYSPEVCRFCGVEKETPYEQYAYCHNTQCLSYHMYSDGAGPLLMNKKGIIPDSKEVDTSKDTPTIQYRNLVYADFVERFDTYNSMIKSLIQTFNTLPAYDFTDSIDIYALNDQINTDTIIVDSSYDLNVYINQIQRGSSVSIRHYDEASGTFIHINSKLIGIKILSDAELGEYGVLHIEDEVSVNDNDTITISNFRSVKVTIDDWIHMLDAGIDYKLEYIQAKKVYDKAVETGIIPAGSSIEELEEEMNRTQSIYTHSLYYLIGLLSEFVNTTNSDIDLSTYMWSPEKSIRELLDDIDAYDALLGLKSKIEIREFISNQLDDLTNQVITSSAPYAYTIDDTKWVKIYLNNHFLNRNWSSSRLNEMIQTYFLDDYDEYVSNVKYGNQVSGSREAALTYMDETMYSADGNPKIFDYIRDHIKAIIDANMEYTTASRSVSDFDTESSSDKADIDIGIGRPVTSFNQLRQAYNGISQLYSDFVTLTWNARDHRSFAAVRRLQKMLMTTRYAEEIYSINSGATNRLASSYKELLDSLNPILSIRVDNMNEEQRIMELENSLSCLDKISDDLIYIHSYGGFNMKKMISYIFKLIIFFKSAKADLLDFALEFRVDDKTDNLIKYMTELTKLSTSSSVSADQWAIEDLLEYHKRISCIDPKRITTINFSDVCIGTYHGFKINSADFFGDQIRVFKGTTHVMELDNVLYDLFKQESRHANISNMRDNYKHRYLKIKDLYDRASVDRDLIPDGWTLKSLKKYMEYIKMLYDTCSNDKNSYMSMKDEAILAMRKVYALDMDAEPTYDEHGNAIYPYKYNEFGDKVVEEYYNIL
jgi:hypothetical protein